MANGSTKPERIAKIRQSMWDHVPMDLEVHAVTSDTLGLIQPLMRSYCDFYGVHPEDSELLRLSEALAADPSEGIQFVARARGATPAAVGFATVFWSWSTLSASRIGVMNDLFVDQRHRGGGVAEALIKACSDACRGRGATHLTWQTALDNHRAQAVYDRVGATQERWLDYSIEISSG